MSKLRYNRFPAEDQFFPTPGKKAKAMFHEMMNTKYCILLKDGSYVYGFHPESGCVDVTYSNALALPFNSTTAAMRFVDKYGKPGNGLAAHLIQGFRPITEALLIA